MTKKKAAPKKKVVKVTAIKVARDNGRRVDAQVKRLIELGDKVAAIKAEVDQLRENDVSRRHQAVQLEHIDLARRTEARLHDHLSNHDAGAYERENKSIQILSGRCDSFTKLLNEQHDKLMEEIKATEMRVSQLPAVPLAYFSGLKTPPPEWVEICEIKSQLERTASNIRVEMHDSIASLSENVSSLQELVLRQEKQIAGLVGKNGPPVCTDTISPFRSVLNTVTGTIDVDASITEVQSIFANCPGDGKSSLLAALRACGVWLTK